MKMFLVRNVRIARKAVGTKILFTSPDVRGLFVALDPQDEYRAEESIRSALAMLERMEADRGAVHEVQQVRQERLYA